MKAAGAVKQLEVANGREGIAASLHVEPWAEELGTGALQEQAARVVGEVVLPPLQFVIALQEQVVVAEGEEAGLGGRKELRQSRTLH